MLTAKRPGVAQMTCNLPKLQELYRNKIATSFFPVFQIKERHLLEKIRPTVREPATTNSSIQEKKRTSRDPTTFGQYRINSCAVSEHACVVLVVYSSVHRSASFSTPSLLRVLVGCEKAWKPKGKHDQKHHQTAVIANQYSRVAPCRSYDLHYRSSDA